MILVPLRGPSGLSAMVDDSDYGLVASYPWYLMRNDVWIYATTRITRTIKSMHSLITGWPYVDHVDCDGLNNQRENLRPSNPQLNGRNRRPNRGASSQYKGVSWNGRNWHATITVDGRRIHLGRHDDELEAARAYDRAAIELFGEHARPNGVLV